MLKDELIKAIEVLQEKEKSTKGDYERSWAIITRAEEKKNTAYELWDDAKRKLFKLTEMLKELDSTEKIIQENLVNGSNLEYHIRQDNEKDYSND